MTPMALTRHPGVAARTGLVAMVVVGVVLLLAVLALLASSAFGG